MYKPGEMIFYGSEGVCRVEAVGPIDISDRKKLYYTLQPLYRQGKIFVPVESKVFSRPVITRQQAEDLLRRIPTIQADVYENRNLRMLNEHYQTLMQTHNCEDMLHLIRSVYIKQQQLRSQGKKAGLIDERYMKRAEDLLYGELAVALDISKDSVLDYIISIVESSV